MNWFMKLCMALCVVTSAVCATEAFATDFDRTTGAARDAQTAYERGIQLRRTDAAASLDAFRESAKLWERIRTAGAENGPLEFNLGNADMESGDIGRAIAAELLARGANVAITARKREPLLAVAAELGDSLDQK